MILWFGQMMGPRKFDSGSPGPAIWDKTFDDSNGIPDIGTGTLTFTCSTTHGYFNNSGLFAVGAIDTITPDYDPVILALKGIGMWQTKTNVCLHSADMTQAAWVKLNVTANKNQTGFDGVANSATLLTATANGGTALQAVVLASSARGQYAYVKRVIGSGTVEMTMDGTTWIDITSQITGIGPNGYSVCTIPTQTIANPTFGFRFGTSGDAIAVSHFQNENGTVITASIPTTTTAVTRGSMALSAATSGISGFNNSEGTIYIETSGASSTTTTGFASLNTNANNYIALRGINGHMELQVRNGGVDQAGVGSTSILPMSGTFKSAGSWKVNQFNESTNGSAETPDLSGTVPTVSTLSVGATTGTTNPANTFIKRITLYARAANGDYLRTMTV